MRFRLTLPALLAAMVLATGTVLAGPAPAYAPPASRDAGPIAGVDVDTSSAIVVLREDPLATYDGHLKGFEKTRPDHGKLNPNSAAVKKYLGYLKNEHSDFAHWLQKNVPSAKITSEFFTVLNGVAVQLNGNAIGRLSNNADVVTIEYNALYHPSMTQSVGIINAAPAWASAGGQPSAGTGIKVGVIDSGIDYRHPFFDPAGFSYPAGFPKCDAADSHGGSCEYVSPKVIVAKVFYNKYPQSQYDAMPIPGVGDHGTHVAGTVAGVVTTPPPTVEGVAIAGTSMSGVAPGAWLGNYNVFPGDVVNARSEDILNAVEAAVDDGMDVITLSLGGAYHGNNDLLAMGLDDAVAAGVVVTVAAGNSGPGPYTLESPGRARNIITAGASTNRHFVGQPVTAKGETVGAAVGGFAKLDATTYGAVDTGSTACNGSNLGNLSGKLAFVNRGTCVFSEKVANAKSAGAIAVIVVNNVAGDPSAMARSAGYEDGIPAVMVGKADGNAIRTATSVAASADLSEFITGNQDILAGFSSQGPTYVDEAIKPDVTSVGVNVLSSIPCTNPTGTTCDDANWAFYSGTSMATPHLAGSAAVLLGIHPAWSPAQVKSALVNTADQVVKDAVSGAATVGPMGQGAGRENLGNAANATVSFAPVSFSFGKINASKNQATPLAVTVTNSGSSSVVFTLAATQFTPATGAPGMYYAAGSSSVGDDRIEFAPTLTLAGGETQTLTLTVKPGLANGTIVQGWLTLTPANGQPYHLAYWAEVAP